MKPLSLFTLISDTLSQAPPETLDLIAPGRKGTNKRYYQTHRAHAHPRKPGRPKGKTKAKTSPKKTGRPPKLLQANMTRAALARLAGVSLTTVTKVLNGNRFPSPEVLVKIANVLDLTPSELKRCILNASLKA